MGRYKCAYECESSDDADEKYFKFPLCNERRLKKWLANMKWKDWTPSRFSVLCSKHFEEQHLDRTGKCVQLREDAVPTIFLPQDEASKTKTDSTPRGRRKKQVSTVASQTSLAAPSATVIADEEELAHADAEVELEDKVLRWRIVMDQSLVKITSLPHFFHGDYCAQQDVQWAPDTDVMTSAEEIHGLDPEKVIEVTAAWQWLGLDVRGPLPPTHNGHKYVVTLSDYYSKWVEAAAVPSYLPMHVAKHIGDAVCHFGLPLRILSRLPRDAVVQINQELARQLTTDVSLVVQHPHTGAVDLNTQHMIDRMVSDLVDEHAADWDVFLPAKVFALCFQEHSHTKERPFALLCCQDSELVHSPLRLHYTDTQIQESAFLVQYGASTITQI
ncbi:RUS1 family protein C16orf58 homolog isoform X4 [Phycodurus eques]|uniref:RUS1 family protein C16orf58 homolog isoform X4 n=1 Tax=Phycodurus eques TaxID=693459 RepID=UPI002ACD9FD1|nr:RUS1 family protein C16orf58 homolog isoform X4 [Phycodurus eques]